ncbi:uncharacterized protein [Triticum aestivum]|uniref:uncharacterized protein n=1 Tax=Triticum aestivum TaxID=4565 RepID=UPI001ABD0022|nr:uncharacterized protein LOC120966898 [Aegilops tauschii subsp. strangulata]XP_044417334.1 uncharacterized protein LOC123142517 [Triticum aestivum]
MVSNIGDVVLVMASPASSREGDSHGSHETLHQQRKVPAPEVLLLTALAKIKKAKLDTSAFFEALGMTESPGGTWMFIFTAQGKLEKGRYFPMTAVQRFDATGKRIENGVSLGPAGSLSFEVRLSWKKKINAAPCPLPYSRPV